MKVSLPIPCVRSSLSRHWYVPCHSPSAVPKVIVTTLPSTTAVPVAPPKPVSTASYLSCPILLRVQADPPLWSVDCDQIPDKLCSDTGALTRVLGEVVFAETAGVRAVVVGVGVSRGTTGVNVFAGGCGEVGVNVIAGAVGANVFGGVRRRVGQPPVGAAFIVLTGGCTLVGILPVGVRRNPVQPPVVGEADANGVAAAFGAPVGSASGWNGGVSPVVTVEEAGVT